MQQGLQTAEAKRARQRMYVKTSYYRQQNVMKALRQELHDLELKYSQSLQQLQYKQQQQQWSEAGGNEEDTYSVDLVERYMQLSTKKQELQRENQEMALLAAKHETFRLKVEHWGGSDGAPMLEPPPITVELSNMVFEPMTVSECHHIAIAAYREICAFLQSNSYLTTGAVLCGWRDRLREAADHVKFTLKKRFIGITPMELLARAWHVVSSPRGLAGLYSTDMRLSLKVLQIVDDHNVVMYRVIRNAQTQRAVQSVFLVSRFKVASGYMVLFRSVDRNRLRKLCQGGTVNLDDQGDCVGDNWLDMFTWTLFEDEPGNENAVVFSYGGIVYSTEAVNTHTWMLEILLLAMRWEAKVVRPPFMLGD
uniref:Uncharacterized protein n=2 Tax=Phytophthora ramorum TaxID=164328 RepID=H3GCP4_PHYRM